MIAFIRRRVVDPIVALLRQGITPERIALSLACGAILGIFPVLGTTTVLCTAAAVVTLWDAIVHAVVGWLVLGPIATYALYRALIPVLARAARRFQLRPAI